MKHILLIIMSLVFLKANAQDPAYPPVTAPPLNVVKAEYFIDVDPGFGLGINIPVTAAVNIAGLVQTINISALSPGLHKLGVRTLNAEGSWSITSTILFAIDPDYPSAPAVPLIITKAEYFFDTDPGFGLGADVPLTAAVDIAGLVASVNTAALTTGTHFLYLRTLSVEGSWSVTSVKQFIVDEDPAYPLAPAAPGNITYAEYFFDTDPGFGNGTSIALTPGVDISNLTFAANTASLTTGVHRLYIRSLDDWSITSVRDLQVDATLPITFISFSGIEQGNDVLLNWATATEHNSSNFEIQRSSNGSNFVAVGTVAAAGTSSVVKNYQFTDAGLAEGIYYYRLKQVDIDGRFIYTDILRIHKKAITSIAVIPNPVATQLYISGIKAGTKIVVYDAAGKQVLAQTWSGQPVPVQQLPKGIYTVFVTVKNQNLIQKFIKN
jgi:hypothetical protein